MRRGRAFFWSLVIVFVFLFALEGIQRIRHPHVGFRGMTNSRGFRSQEFDPKKEPGTTRILFYGSSTTFGVSNPLEKTFPFLVGQILQEKLPGRKIETLNAALSNKTSDWLVERILGTLSLEPDVIVILTGYNDSASVHQKTVKIDELGNLVMTPWYFQLHGYLAHISVLYVTLREKIAIWLYGNPRYAFGTPRQIQHEESLKSENWFRHYPPYYRKNLEKIIQIAEEHGIKLAFIKPPLSAQRRREHPLYRKAFFRLRRELEKAASEHGIPLINLDPFFSSPGSGKYFSEDGLHFSDTGNGVLARAVSDFILQHLQDDLPQTIT